MRDLGLMGESIFSFWCADAGLIPNGSKIDKTGWDFFVEFPFDYNADITEIHKSAFECKIQIKATDKNKRKLSITLSNLRRLITAQMPAFFVFIEFDGTSTAQRAFIVHVDNEFISKVLKRLHKIEQREDENKFNKRTMTIHYDDSHMMQSLNGTCLKEVLLNHMGDNMADYVAKKKKHLESTGFEKGFGQITFVTEGEENIKDIIDASLGIKKQVAVTQFKGSQTRFGIANKNPFIEADSGKLEILDLKPKAEGIIRFKEDKLSPGLSFPSKLFVSPLNSYVPKELRKVRVEGEFYDLKFNPYTGEANYSFSFGEGVRLEVKKFRDAIKLLNLLSYSEKELYSELIFEGLPKLQFRARSNKKDEFDFSKELNALESAVKLLSEFNVTDCVEISLDEASLYEPQISQMRTLVETSPGLFKVEFEVEGEDFDPSKKAACVFMVTAPVGSHIFGILLVLIGDVEVIEANKFNLIV